MELFRALGLSENVLAALQKKGFEKPSPIQEQTIPTLLNTNRDVVGQAQTGTGKTAAFGLPLIERIEENERSVQAIVLCPTRELAVQVAEEILSFRGNKRISVLPVYGGQSYEIQIRGLKKGAHIVVGTPGRVRDHIAKGTLKLNDVKFMVLDEADEMLNMGFEEEVREILKEIPKERRMLLFSATMPPNILKLVKTYIKPDYMLVEVQKEQVTTETVDQIYYEVHDRDRFEALCRVLDTNPNFYGIVFCKTKIETDQLASKLNDRGYIAEGIHGDVTQSQRELILKSFKSKRLRVLVATDVAARGIDVNDLSHVVNYRLPQDPEAYVHRIGRTGRAGKKGIALTLVSPADKRDFIYIEKVAKTKIRREILPTVDQVIDVKKNAFKKKIQMLLEMGASEEYHELAQELIGELGSAEDLVAALLKYSVKDELTSNNYAEVADIAKNKTGRSGAGPVRLFVAKGKDDRFNKGDIIEFLEAEGGINGASISEIRIFDKFTFINIEPEEAEQLLVIFSRKKGNGKPLVTRAKERDGSGSSSGGRSFEGRSERSSSDFGSRERSSGSFKSRSNDRSESGRERKPLERSSRDRFSGFKQDSFENKQSERPAYSKTTSEPKDLDKALKDFESFIPSKKKKSTSNNSGFEPKFSDDLSW
jgi:ATP-dependent RNA helicase DeaD